MKTAVIYVRVRVAQNSQEAIDRQMELCKQFACEKGLTVVDTYIDNEEFGKPKQRVSLEKMLKDCRKAMWDTVITHNSDRMTRNVRQLMKYEDTLEKYGKSLLIVTAPEDYYELKKFARECLKYIREWRKK